MRQVKNAIASGILILAMSVSCTTPSPDAEMAATDEVSIAVPDYRPGGEWPQLPEGYTWGEVSGVAVDRDGEVLVFHRGEHPLMEFKQDGTFIRSWGEGSVARAHGLRVDANNNIWVTDVGSHTVTKYDQQGNVLLILGEKGVAGEDESHFNQPADVAVASNGDIFVADGYGNSRVVKFDKDGKFIKAWGKKGTGQGEFNLVHAVVLDPQGRLYVGDRENNRIQIFDQDGNFIDMWTDVGAPFGLAISGDKLYIATGRDQNVNIVDLEGTVLTAFGSEGTELGHFNLPHGITVAETGDIYIAEIRNERTQKFVLK
ncbi:MAG: peptidyl-alpha-hydroxyglycine alpha-amidating lyase family protein [Acidobacteriota bacterium]